MKMTRHLPIQTRRDAWVEVDLGAIEQNAKKLVSFIDNKAGMARSAASAAVMAIVKADAYGHGAVMVAPTLEASGVTMLGVASIDEAIQIREARIETPVLVIGAIPDWAVQAAAEHDIALTIFERHHLQSLRQAFEQAKTPVKVHIKVDTGMHRIGVPWEEAADFVRQSRELPHLQLEGIFSHLASPEDETFTAVQLDRWNKVLNAVEKNGPLPRWVHMANSAGALLHNARGNLVRIGIGVFGYGDVKNLGLKPAMGLKARILRLEEIAPESGISYGHTYKTPPGKPSMIATVPVGYADGIPRILSNKIEGILNGQRIKQVGTITMDQMMFDVTGIPARLGDAITLIGREGEETITLSDWAEKAGTIEYELMCALRVRLPKTYTRD